MPVDRIATCCYCGTSTALPRKAVPGRISCTSCGAPLRRLGRAAPVAFGTSGRTRAAPVALAQKDPRARQRKPLVRRLWDRAKDVVEDVVDDILD